MLRKPKRRALVTMLVVFAIPLLPSLIFFTMGLRLNLTSSMPLGIYKIVKKKIEIGDTVLFCMSDPRYREMIIARDYIPYGKCAGGYAPLLKEVIALEGTRYSVTEEGMFLNNALVPESRPLQVDRKGRPMFWTKSGKVGKDEILVFSSLANSLDSRYFGPVKAKDIIGVYLYIGRGGYDRKISYIEATSQPYK